MWALLRAAGRGAGGPGSYGGPMRGMGGPGGHMMSPAARSGPQSYGPPGGGYGGPPRGGGQMGPPQGYGMRGGCLINLLDRLSFILCRMGPLS